MLEDFDYRGVTSAEKRGQSELPKGAKPYQPDNILSQGRASTRQPFRFRAKTYDTWDKNSHWKANLPIGMERLSRAGRLHVAENSIRYVRYHTDSEVAVHGNIWTDTGTGNFTDDKTYVVQTNSKIIPTLPPHDHRPRRPRARPHLRLRHHRLRGRTVGPPLDHDRHLARRPRAGTRPHHGRTLSLLPAGRQPRRAAERGRDRAQNAFRNSPLRRHPPGLRL